MGKLSEALGIVEVKGLIAAVTATDAMAKAANIRILDKVAIGNALRRDSSSRATYGSVRAAVDAGRRRSATARRARQRSRHRPAGRSRVVWRSSASRDSGGGLLANSEQLIANSY